MGVSFKNAEAVSFFEKYFLHIIVGGFVPITCALIGIIPSFRRGGQEEFQHKPSKRLYTTYQRAKTLPVGSHKLLVTNQQEATKGEERRGSIKKPLFRQGGSLLLLMLGVSAAACLLTQHMKKRSAIVKKP